VESAVFFDELTRSGRDKEMTNPGRAARMAHHAPDAGGGIFARTARSGNDDAKLADATKDVDVYLVPSGAGAGGGGGRGRGAASDSAPPAAPQRRASVTQRHFNMANVAGYPALAVPNGFAESGSPGSITFHGAPLRRDGTVGARQSLPGRVGLPLDASYAGVAFGVPLSLKSRRPIGVDRSLACRAVRLIDSPCLLSRDREGAVNSQSGTLFRAIDHDHVDGQLFRLDLQSQRCSA